MVAMMIAKNCMMMDGMKDEFVVFWSKEVDGSLVVEMEKRRRAWLYTYHVLLQSRGDCVAIINKAATFNASKVGGFILKQHREMFR